jgi:hypothetical protein
VNPAAAPDQVIQGPRGRYRILSEHGRGGFGVTYRGEREADGQPVIVKMLHLAGLPGWKGFELFEREAAALRALRHPNVPAWIDDIVFGQEGSAESRNGTGFALVMELIPGRNLRDTVRGGGLSPEQMCAWLRDVLEVLAFIHGRSPPLIHRDVNPKNIILRPDGSAALVDFGSVQAALRSADTVASTSAGTFGYAPLEQFIGQATPVSDLYSVGMTFLAASAGREPNQLPFQGLKADVRQVLREPPHIVRLIEAMVEPDPRFRLASAATALELLAGRPTSAAVARVDSGHHDVIPAAPGVGGDYLARLSDKLMDVGFDLASGGEVGRSPLAFAAHRPPTGLNGLEIHIYAARAELVVGAGGTRALPPVPAALFVEAAAALHAQRPPGFWRRLLGQQQLVVPLFVCGAGVGPRTRGHIAGAVPGSGTLTVVPAIVDLLGEGFELITPPSLLGGDPGGLLETIRRLLAVDLLA